MCLFVPGGISDFKKEIIFGVYVNIYFNMRSNILTSDGETKPKNLHNSTVKEKNQKKRNCDRVHLQSLLYIVFSYQHSDDKVHTYSTDNVV